MPDIIHFHRVSHRYDTRRDILGEVTFTLQQGEMAFLTGPSGSGKTTLLKLVSALEKPNRGQIIVNQQNLANLKSSGVPLFRQDIGMVFQNAHLLNDRTVFDNVALPLLIRGYRYDDVARRVRAALDAVGLLSKEKAPPITLSGGEQQRVGIARAIVAKPALILADEPTGNLDPARAREVMGLFQRFNEVGVSVLIATHAIGLIQRLPYRILHLENGALMTRTPSMNDRTQDFG
jgi:cell division transport system ATP-binding protein